MRAVANLLAALLLRLSRVHACVLVLVVKEYSAPAPGSSAGGVRNVGYHIDRLEPAMKEETWRFIAEIIRTNKPVTALVDAGLARLYELPNVTSDHLQRVSLPADSLRRGLLGQASILTITGNGVETSPVKRGVWLPEKRQAGGRSSVLRSGACGQPGARRCSLLISADGGCAGCGS